MPNRPTKSFGIGGFGEYSRGIRLLHPDAAALWHLRDSATKAGLGQTLLSRDKSSAFRQNVEQQRDLLERTIADPSRFVETIQTLNTLQTATNNLVRQDRTELRAFIRNIILRKLSAIDIQASSLKADPAKVGLVAETLFRATVGSTSDSDVEHIVATALAHLNTSSQDAMQEAANIFTEKVGGIEDEDYGVVGLASMLTRANATTAANLGRIVFRDQVGEALLDGETTESFYQRHLQAYGLNPTEVLPAWHKSTSKLSVGSKHRRITYDEMYYLHYMALKALENDRPGKGIAKALATEFKVFDFARYPKYVLLSQFDQRNIRNLPYVVAVVGRGDWNNAFMYNEEPSVIGMLQDRLEKLGYGLRIVESENGKDMQAVFAQLDSKYSPRGAKYMSAALVFGHGSKDSISLGSSDEGYSRPEDGITAGEISAIRGYFTEPDPPIVLMSCSTGVEGGVASRFSEEGLIINAPVDKANLAGIQVSKFQRRGGRLHFIPKFVNEDGRSVESRIYVAGVMVEPQPSPGYAAMVQAESIK